MFAYLRLCVVLARVCVQICKLPEGCGKQDILEWFWKCLTPDFVLKETVAMVVHSLAHFVEVAIPL